MTEQEQRRSFGWIPDLPDFRDYDAPTPAFHRLPEFVRLDLEPWMPPVYDQERLGSCTANALAAAVEYDLRRQGFPDFMPSRLFIYYNERVIEHTTDYDTGAMIRDGAKTLHKIGVCHETTWPYNVERFAVKPSEEAYAEASDTRAVAYRRVARGDVRAVLAAGTPIVFGFTVYDNFESIGADGIMPNPEGEILGAHAVVLCGYSGRYYRVRNSWGVGVEDEGYFWMPREYVTHPRLSSDFWAIQVVS